MDLPRFVAKFFALVQQALDPYLCLLDARSTPRRNRRLLRLAVPSRLLLEPSSFALCLLSIAKLPKLQITKLRSVPLPPQTLRNALHNYHDAAA